MIVQLQLNAFIHDAVSDFPKHSDQKEGYAYVLP